jgi:multiple sugar transport system substrate-binding protein
MKKILLMVVILVLTMTLVTAGGQAEPEKQKLVFWGKQAQDRATDELIREILTTWGNENNVDVEYTTITSEVQKQKYAAAFETGNVPDVITFDGDFCKYYATQGVLSPLDDFYAELSKRGGGMFDAVLPVLKNDGNLYGIPFQNDIYFFYVRKDLVEGVGESIPQNWDDVARISVKIKEKYDISPFGHPLAEINDAEFSTRIMLWAYDAHIFDKDGNIDFDTPETLELFKLVKKMYQDDKTIPKGSVTWNDSGNNEAYQMKQSAFIINPGSVYRWVKENDDELHNNTILARMPAGPRGTRANLTACWAVSLPKDSPNQELAQECLRYLYDVTNYNTIIESAGSRYLPVYRDLFDTPFWNSNPKFEYLKDMLSEAKVVGYEGPASSAASEMLVQRVLTKAFSDMLVHGMSAEDSIKKADSEFRKIASSF